jgi:5-(carboxyamino)imidazole ribonucleotide mutase
MKDMKVIIMAGSDSDKEHIQKIKNELEKFSIKSVIRICSAHKQPSKCEEIINNYNNEKNIVYVTIAGGTDALSGVVSFHSVHPVISCPPDDMEFDSCLFNPPGSSNSLILKPKNVARHIAQIFSSLDDNLRELLLNQNKEKIEKLNIGDEKFQDGL